MVGSRPLDADQAHRLRLALSRILGRDIQQTEIIDDTIIEAWERVADALDTLPLSREGSSE